MEITAKNISVSLISAGVVIALAFMLSATSAFAGTIDTEDNDINVVSSNSAFIMNGVMTASNTGNNQADGGDGGNGSTGGDAEGNGNNTGGNGGDAGHGGIGGVIYTGNATSTTAIGNDVNRSNIRVIGCGCGDDDCDNTCDQPEDRCGYRSYKYDRRGNDVTREDNDININDTNEAAVMNLVGTLSNTGDNVADGGDGGNGSAGGDATGGQQVQVKTWGHHHGGSQTPTTNRGGAGGDGGNGGGDGRIETGSADSATAVVNVVNQRLVRVNR